MANREPGFYWVKIGMKWRIAEFNKSGVWTRTPWIQELRDAFWDEIDERRIERPEELTPDRVFYDYKQEQGK